MYGHWRLVFLTFFAFFALHGCTSQMTMNFKVSKPEQDFVIETAQSLCDFSLYQKIESKFSEGVALTKEATDSSKEYCPVSKGESRLVGYQSATVDYKGKPTLISQFVVITESVNRWTITSIATEGKFPDSKVIAWSLRANATKPQDVLDMESYDRFMSYVLFSAIAATILAAGMIARLAFRRTTPRLDEDDEV